LTVVNTNDSGPGSLRAILSAANDGDTVKFDDSLNGQMITLTSGDLAIDVSLTIQGLGADQSTISGNNTSRIFDITNSAAAVSISGLTITDGRAQQGGGIYDEGGTLNLSHSVLTDNRAIGESALGNFAYGSDGLGGGVYVATGTLSVDHSTFADDEAIGGTGNGIQRGFGGNGAGGGIYLLLSTLTLTHSQFIDNLAQGGDGTASAGLGTYSAQGGGGGGGGIFEEIPPPTMGMGPPVPPPGAYSPVTVTDTEFNGNEAIGGAATAVAASGVGDQSVSAFGGSVGGGGMSVGSFGQLTVTSCKFVNNESIGGAATVSASNGLAEDGGGSSSGLSAGAPSVISDDEFIGNVGGGLFATDTDEPVSNCVFRDNVGPGVWLYGTSPTISSCVFTGNLGSGVRVAATGTITISDSQFRDNQSFEGGAIDANSGSAPSGSSTSLIVERCDLVDNRAMGILTTGGNAQYHAGGGIFDAFGDLTVINSRLEGNEAVGVTGILDPAQNSFDGGNGVGGGIAYGVNDFGVGGSDSVDGSVVIVNSELINNHAIGSRHLQLP
jgi:hypothetical protein